MMGHGPAKAARESAPAKYTSNPLLDAFGYDPETAGMGGLEWWFSPQDRRDEVEQTETAKAQFASALDSLNLSPQDRVRAQMDPEGFFRSLNEIQTANMKPQTDSFWDPVAKQWMRKPQGPMAVAKGTDLVDPETKQAIYSNEADPEPTKYGFENFDGAVWAVNPADPSDRRRMGAAPQGTPPAPKATYRWASPEEVTAAGLPPGTAMQVNELTGEAAIKRTPTQTQEYDPVTIRRFKKSVEGLDLLDTQIDRYKQTLKANGGPQNVKGPWNTQQTNAIETSRNNVLVLAKELYELGALVGADFAIIEAAVKPATGVESTFQTNESIGTSLDEISSMLRNKMSQMPEDVIDQVRGNYSGPMKERFAPKAARPATQNPMVKLAINNYSRTSGIPPEALSEFLANPNDPEEVRQFNEAFGDGQAEAILGAMQGGN